MLVVVPVQEEAAQESLATSVKRAKSFAFLYLGEGMRLERLEFRESFADELFDYIVTTDKNDDLEEAYDLGARALLAMPGMCVEDVVEGLMFRELDEIV